MSDGLPGADHDAADRPARLLIATAVAAERDALARGLATTAADPERVNVVAVGVGPAAAAAGCAVELLTAARAGRPYAAVVSAGIAGGFVLPDEALAEIGSLALANRMIAADLGAESPDGFLSLDKLGYGTATLPADPSLTERLAKLLADAGLRPRRGDALTVATVTGTAARAAELRARYPCAITEGMEGFGIANAALACGVPALELRAVSNAVGPRDRSAWRIGDALAALTAAAPALALLLPSPKDAS
jgi:futalosine hydrolase